MTYTDELRRRMCRLWLDPDSLPELLPCAHCQFAEQIDINVSLISGTYAICCLMDGWTTSDHTDLLAAIHEWNGEQLRAIERRYQRLVRAGMRVH